METRSATETPLMRQYLEVKEKYPDSIVFFRLGDFYEMFYEDAVYAASILDLTLTSRDRNKENRVPMCGVPYHAAKQYIGKLLEQGKKIAICEQVEDPRLAKKIVRRAVTQVITPGVVVEEDHLTAKTNHYLAAVATQPDGTAGIAYLDVSTGEFCATHVPVADLFEEVCRIHPSELIDIQGTLSSEHGNWIEEWRRRFPIALAQGACPSAEEEHSIFSTLPKQDANLRLLPALARSAAAACIQYANAMHMAGKLPVFSLRAYRPEAALQIDDTTRRHLELFQTDNQGRVQGSLLWVLDHTCTAPGGRLLRRWLGTPTQDLQEIERRHDAVGWLIANPALRESLRTALSELHDLERLVGRLTLDVATPRDLRKLASSLLCLPGIQRLLQGSPPDHLTLEGDLCQDVASQLDRALTEDPPVLVREGGIFRPGYNAELDAIVALAQGGKQGILDIEQRERERTKISSLKVSYNRVFGYYIEITRTHLGKVPADYIRKQTLAQAERFVTPELSEYEAKVLGAEERRLQLEEELFLSLRRSILPHALRIKDLADILSKMDVLVSLAHVAERNRYVRPEMTTTRGIQIQQGRHPVLEQILPSGQFVPNDVHLDPDSRQVYLITGPNMAGKSTIMRQTVQICILAQMGSFVPAKQARLGILDRVFARVGASDNLTAGESTFMVEMRETAAILKNATPRSLVLMDEIGRGTSTYDGISIAWAVAEHLHDSVGCSTLFATHYHELCRLAETHPRIHNVSVAVRQHQGQVVFLHRLVEGPANRSYGIEVAQLAGVPPRVLDRAKEILHILEADVTAGGSSPHRTLGPLSPQLALFTPAPPPPPAAPALSEAERTVLDALRTLDPLDTSPRQALTYLLDWTQQLRNRQSSGQSG